MDLTPWRLEFKPGWDVHFQHFDKSVQTPILNKFDHMEQPLSARGLNSSRVKVEEVGQYRIAFTENSINQIKNIYFVGDHKQYQQWYKSAIKNIV